MRKMHKFKIGAAKKRTDRIKHTNLKIFRDDFSFLH